MRKKAGPRVRSVVEQATVAVYEDRGAKWAEGVRAERKESARSFGSEIATGKPRVDVGCGAGRYTGFLGRPCIGLDAARSMLHMCRKAVPETLLVQADMEELPFAPRAIEGAWANMSYLHIPRKRLPAALAELHRALGVGAPVDIQVLHGDFEGTGLPDDRVGGRFFAAWQVPHLTYVAEGAGFTVTATETDQGGPGQHGVLRVRAHRARTLPDMVGPGMRLLVCGLNPSVYSADAGIGFARPGNRFWPAASASGLVTKIRDPRHALRVDRVGMTDMVKRATPNASALSTEEYRHGANRLERLVAWLEPAAVCFVGLAGWRAAIDRKAVAGVQELRFGGRPAYVMPSTSGLNANSTLADLTAHMEQALMLAESS
jgi:double-stranded uracil-DNA glycosylase